VITLKNSEHKNETGATTKIEALEPDDG